MEKPTTERTWNVIPCFIKCLKEDRQRHSEEHSLSSQIWEAATFGYCNGRQDYIPTSAPAAQGGLPESNTNLQVRIKNSELDWLMLPPFENELTLTEELRQASDQWTHILLMHKKKNYIFHKTKRLFGKTAFTCGKAPDFAFTTRRTCYAGFKHSRW